MATINLGRVGFVNKGAHNIATAYKVNDVVTYNGGTYACIQAHTGQLPTVTAYWQNWVANDKALDSAVVHKTGDTMSGNLNFASGTKITGDFSNATAANRTLVQSNTVNGYTSVDLIPNGTSQVSQIQFVNNSDPTNASVSGLGVNATDSRLFAGRNGTGTYLPLTFYTNSTERMRIDTAGNVLVTGSGALGYGTGSGGTVTQLTSKSTAVTLNKPSGQITMSSATLAAGAVVSFNVNNSLITSYDNVDITFYGNVSSVQEKYSIEKTVVNGAFSVTLKNLTVGSLSEAVTFNFTLIKGANS